MGIVKGKWQGHLEAAQASGLSLAGYAAREGINVRRLYEARHTEARAKAAKARKASAFMRVALKSPARSARPVEGAALALRGEPAPVIAMQARLGNGVVLSWTHDVRCGPLLADLMHTLAGLPCSA
jgi:hypothetical protein